MNTGWVEVDRTGDRRECDYRNAEHECVEITSPFVADGSTTFIVGRIEYRDRPPSGRLRYRFDLKRLDRREDAIQLAFHESESRGGIPVYESIRT